jgi:hypothetical protein
MFCGKQMPDVVVQDTAFVAMVNTADIWKYDFSTHRWCFYPFCFQKVACFALSASDTRLFATMRAAKAIRIMGFEYDPDQIHTMEVGQQIDKQAEDVNEEVNDEVLEEDHDMGEVEFGIDELNGEVTDLGDEIAADVDTEADIEIPAQ